MRFAIFSSNDIYRLQSSYSGLKELPVELGMPHRYGLFIGRLLGLICLPPPPTTRPQRKSERGVPRSAMKGSRASSPNPAFNVDAGSSTPADFAAASAFVDYLKQKVREKGGSGSTSVSATAVQTFHDQEQRLLSLQLQITKGPASDYRSQEPCLNLAAEIEELRAVRVKTTSTLTRAFAKTGAMKRRLSAAAGMKSAYVIVLHGVRSNHTSTIVLIAPPQVRAGRRAALGRARRYEHDHSARPLPRHPGRRGAIMEGAQRPRQPVARAAANLRAHPVGSRPPRV